MPRYKLSPEERAAEKERKENLRNIMRGLDIKSFDDLKDAFKIMVREMLENGLDGELDDELGYTKYDYRNKEGENSRNGYSKKTLKTSFGETEIKVPRDRNSEFEPQLVKKNQTTLTGDIEEKIISMYAINSGYNASAIGHGTKGQIAKCSRISWSSSQTGDLAFYGDLSHVGIVAGKDAAGNILVNVSFRYNDNGNYVLSHFSLHVSPGENIAVVGPSGG